MPQKISIITINYNNIKGLEKPLKVLYIKLKTIMNLLLLMEAVQMVVKN